MRKSQELKLSHFLPAGVYRATRDESQENPNPIMISDDCVRQDSKQVTAHVLCSECEQRLSKKGENWFLSHCSRKGQFRLATLLDAATPVGASPSITVYHAAQILKIDVSALTYFAASMFWRAAVREWSLKASETKSIQLGSYEERLRTHLMGETLFPQDCVLWVSVPATLTPFTSLSLTPYGSRREEYHMYKLIVLGIGFNLLVGSRIPQVERAMCFVRGQGNPIYRTDLLEQGALQDMARKFDGNPRLREGLKRRR
jgi:hypothetical protein